MPNLFKLLSWPNVINLTYQSNKKRINRNMNIYRINNTSVKQYYKAGFIFIVNLFDFSGNFSK